MPTYDSGTALRGTYGIIEQPVTGQPVGGGVTQPVLGGPTPVGGTQPPPAPPPAGTGQYNPYNLPSDMIGDQTQQQQFGGLLGQFEQARQQANLANEARYQQGLEGYQQLESDYAQRTQDLMGNLQNFGAAQQQELQDRFAQQGAGLSQDMINRGLYSTTTLDQARQGLSRQQQRQQLQLDDILMRQKMDYQKALTGEELANRPGQLGFIERRTDTGPSYQDVLGAAGAYGQSQAGVPDYLSGLGYNQPAVAPGGTGGYTSPYGGSGTLPGNVGEYRTPNTSYPISIRLGRGSTAGGGRSSFDLGGSSRPSSQGSPFPTGGGGGGGGGGGRSGGIDFGLSGSGGRTGAGVLSGMGGGGDGRVDIVMNNDGTFFDGRTGQTYNTMEELQAARAGTGQEGGQTPDQQSVSPDQQSVSPERQARLDEIEKRRAKTSWSIKYGPQLAMHGEEWVKERYGGWA